MPEEVGGERVVSAPTDTASAMVRDKSPRVSASAGDDHPVICRFLKCVAATNPAKPRYSHTWDPALVLSVLRSWGFGLVYWGVTPQQQPGSYQGGEMMMMKSVFWWRKPEHPEDTTDLQQVTDETFNTYGRAAQYNPAQGIELGPEYMASESV